MGRQKRSENTYQKINTIFYRDENNIIMPYDDLVLPELEWLRNCKWDASIKVDGTNIRIEVTPYIKEGNGEVSLFGNIDVRGKTDNANLPNLLEDYLRNTYLVNGMEKIFTAFRLPSTYMCTRDCDPSSPDYGKNIQENVDWMLERGYIKKCGEHILQSKLSDDPNAITVEDYCIDEENCHLPKMFTIYGEGYGKGIQKAGPHYLKDSVSFIGFDVKVTNQDRSFTYLNKEQRDAIFDIIGIPKVIDVGPLTIDEAVDMVKRGFIDPIAEDKDFIAEGLVLKTPDGLRRKNGDRLCVKVKHQDWVKYFNKYGTYDKVSQKRNPKLQ